jgi:hypothetical protein
MRPGRVTADLISRSYGTFTESHPGPNLATNPPYGAGEIVVPAGGTAIRNITSTATLYALRPAWRTMRRSWPRRTILDRYRPDPERQPHLVMRINDPRPAGHWRSRHAGAYGRYFEDALGPPESTAAALAGQLLRTGARRLLLCGDSSLALAILLELARRAWERQELRAAELDEFIRHDNILQLHSIMTAVVQRGRRWVPARSVAPGSFIELTEHDLEEIARVEHTRWFHWRLAAGGSPGDGRSSRRAAGHGAVLINSKVVPWAELPAAERADEIDHLRSQLAQLEDVGFVPIVPAGGPPGAAEFQRIGTVQAKRLRTRRAWARRSGDELSGDVGDWRVLDDSGDERTVRDLEFRASHQPLGGEEWLRTGTFSAWQVSEPQVLRTMEGRAVAQAGDWVVEGYGGERWPVPDEQFRRTYRAVNGHLAT